MLEIGCGTGKATVLFAARGLSIDCVDPGEALLSVARAACRDWPRVRFAPGRFEALDLPEGHYNLIYAAQAFHWVDPNVRWLKCHGRLRAHGSIALLYNFSPLPEGPVETELSEMVHRESGGATEAWDHEESIRKWGQEIESTNLFDGLTVRRHTWVRRCSAEQYSGLFRTYSDFMSMPPEVQGRIADGIGRILGSSGGFIDHRYETVLFHARKAQ